MTSTVALPRPHELRHPSWYAPLLLPILPLLAALSDSDRVFGSAAPLGMNLLLLVLGVAVAFAVPALLDRLGWRVRKEAEQLRSAWLASLFLTQACVLGGPDVAGAGTVLFGLTCALIASLSFGVEFQQRTLSAMLSQPVDRARLWSLKMGVLGAALALHLVVFQVSRLASGFDTTFTEDLGLGLGTLSLAFLAWASTPAWSLLTRSLLPGLVFSIAAPILLLGLFIAFSGDEPTLTLLAFLGIAYGITGHILGRRLWLRFEAPDAPGGDAGSTLVGGWMTTSPALLRARGPSARLSIKELRLQTVTLATAGLTVMLALAHAFAAAQSELASYLAGLAGLFAAITALLGGSTTVAEERRLGTLDIQVLQPLTLRRQWRIKVVAALIPGFVALGAFATVHPADEAIQIAGLAAIVGFSAFALCVLASSVAANALRALLLGMGLIAATWLIGGLFGGEILPLAHRKTREILSASLQTEPATWLAEAARLTPAASAALEQAAGAGRPPWVSSLVEAMVFLLPVLLALIPLALARRNFAHPAQATRRAAFQITALLLFLVTLGVLATVAAVATTRHQTRSFNLLEAWGQLRLEERLSPAQIELRRHVLGVPVSGVQGVQLRIRSFDTGPTRPGLPAVPTGEPRWVTAYYRMPLSPADRATILEHGDIPDAIRDALRREANPDAAPATLPTGRPPGPWPATQNQPSLDLLRRYGIQPRKASPRVGAPNP